MSYVDQFNKARLPEPPRRAWLAFLLIVVLGIIAAIEIGIAARRMPEPAPTPSAVPSASPSS